MTATPGTTPAPKLRLYTDSGETTKLFNASDFLNAVHAMFARWVDSNYLERDFIEAIEHEATLMYINYAMMGSPDLGAAMLKPEGVTSPRPYSLATVVAEAQRVRFYNSKGELQYGVDTDDFAKLLAPYFEFWVRGNFLARDFIQLAKDSAATVYHAYDCHRAFDGGLGGGLTRRQFLDAENYFSR